LAGRKLKLIKLERKHAVKLPKIVLGEKTFDKIGAVVEEDNIRRILKQQKADGGTIKQNKSSTQRRKQAQGKPLLSLIDENHSFIKGRKQTFPFQTFVDHVVVMFSRNKYNDVAFNDLAVWLQKPHPKRNRYVGWFGISKKAWKLIEKITRARIKELIAKAARRSK
jgi:hypothetical protein